MLRLLGDAANTAGPAAEPLGQKAAVSDVERFLLRSGLQQHLLRDIAIVASLRADHEGLGELVIDWGETRSEHRLQALNSLLGALTDRLWLAIGQQGVVDLLRGVADRYERQRP